MLLRIAHHSRGLIAHVHALGAASVPVRPLTVPATLFTTPVIGVAAGTTALICWVVVETSVPTLPVNCVTGFAAEVAGVDGNEGATDVPPDGNPLAPDDDAPSVAAPLKTENEPCTCVAAFRALDVAPVALRPWSAASKPGMPVFTPTPDGGPSAGGSNGLPCWPARARASAPWPDPGA